MSVRLRLTLWYSVVLCLGLAAFGGAVVWQTGRSASAALDDALRQRARDVAADLRLTPTIALRVDTPDLGERHAGDTTLWARVLGPRGQVVVRQGPPVPRLPAYVLAEVQPGLHQWELAGEQHVRMYVAPIERSGRRVATVQMITTTDQIDAARGQLLAAMGVAGILIVLVGGAGGLFLADRVLRPVGRITRLAEQIGAGDLHRRVSDEVWGRAAQRRAPIDELGRLARTFDGMVERLEEAAERRRRLTADAAHELATPIATIASGAEIALRRVRSAEEYQATLQHIVDESRHMGRMVDDLLLLARADSGRLPLQHEVVEIDDVCRQAVRALQPLADERAVTLTATLPPQATLVMGDELRLGQVMRNLLDNALRYTPAGGAVTLRLESAVERVGAAATILLHVVDSGPGIAPAERERVFERFHRAEDGVAATAVRSRAGGSGLGLAICKAIVLAHGGRIWVESTAHGPAASGMPGAHFVVALPGVTDTALPKRPSAGVEVKTASLMPR